MKKLNSLLKLSLVGSMTFLASACQEESIDVTTDEAYGYFSIVVKDGGETTAQAAIRNSNNDALALGDVESLTLTAFGEIYTFNFLEMNGGWIFPTVPSYNIDREVIPTTYAGGEEFRFSWSRQSYGANAENSVVTLPVDPQLSLRGSNILNSMNDYITFDWVLDPDIPDISIRSSVVRCGIELDINNEETYPQVTSRSAYTSYTEAYTDYDFWGWISSPSQSSISTNTLFNISPMQPQLSRIEFVNPVTAHYCKVKFSVSRTKLGELDPKLAGGGISATQSRSFHVYVNVTDMTGTAYD